MTNWQYTSILMPVCLKSQSRTTQPAKDVFWLKNVNHQKKNVESKAISSGHFCDKTCLASTLNCYQYCISKVSVWVSSARIIRGSAKSRRDFVIASHGEMTSVPAGMTPFFLEIYTASESSMQGIAPSLDDAADLHHAPALPFRYSVV